MRRKITLPRLLDEGLFWMLTTCIGWCVGLVVVLVAAASAGLVFSESLSLAVSSFLGGGLIGLIQWRIMRPPVRGAGSWTLASAAGWFVGVSVTAAIAGRSDSLAVILAGAAIGAGVFGFAQWLVMLPAVKRRGEWTLITLLGWTAALALGISFLNTSDGTLGEVILEVAIAGAAGMVVLGAVAMVMRAVLFREGARDVGPRTRWW
jgi:hypothetical protein